MISQAINFIVQLALLLFSYLFPTFLICIPTSHPSNFVPSFIKTTVIMKILKITLITCMFLLAANFMNAQTEVENWDAKIDLDGTELKKEILIKVSDGSHEISVSVSGTISGGNLKVRLYNPKGIREASLNLCASRNSKAKGSLTEVMEAMPGIWKLKVTNDEATGKVNIEVEQN